MFCSVLHCSKMTLFHVCCMSVYALQLWYKYCCDWKALAESAKLHIVAASKNREPWSLFMHMWRVLIIMFNHSHVSISWNYMPYHSIVACWCHIFIGVIFRSHPIRVESHIQHNANWEVQQYTKSGNKWLRIAYFPLHLQECNCSSVSVY